MDEPAPPRSVTIDAQRHDEIVSDLTRQALHLSRRWWLLPRYRRAAREGAHQGLGVGDTVSLAYGEGDTLFLEDATGRLELARGSTPVGRFRSLMTLYSPTLTFVLPHELFTQADVQFLAGPGPDLLLSLEVTPQVQAALVDRATRVVVTSADFLLGPVTALVVTAVAVATQVWGLLYCTAFFLAISAPGVFGVRATRRRMRMLYPVGFTLRAAVTDLQLQVTLGTGTVAGAWPQYTALRVTDDAVLLRMRRRLLTRNKTQVLPRALFGAEELGRLQVAVPGRF